MFAFTEGGFFRGFCPRVCRGFVRFPVQFVQPIASEFCIHN